LPTTLVVDHPIEGADYFDWVVVARGWAVAPGGVASVEVFVNGQSRPARTNLQRADVAVALGNRAARTSGWLVLIGMSDLSAGENLVRVVVHGADGSSAAVERTFRWREPASGKLSALEQGIPARDIDSAYLALLGRHPTASERLVADATGLLATARALASSDEHGELVDRKAPGVFVLAGSEVARTSHPAGTVTNDGVTIVDTDGRMMLDGGTNDFPRQFQGAYKIPGRWVKEWKRVVDCGRERASAAGVPLAQLVVPEKLSVDTAAYPKPLAVQGQRPIEALLGACPQLLYPLASMRGACEPAFLATDCHLTTAGARILFEVTMERLGRAPLTTPAELREYLYLGDLGWRFDPPVFEAGIGPEEVTTVEVLDQNVDEMIPVGGHLGSYRITRNSAAPHRARVLVFGDSYALQPPPGVPGAFGGLLSLAFETVHFCWAPFCWDQTVVDHTQPDLIIQEIGERLIQAVPVLDVDLDALATTTIALKAQAGLDAMFPEQVEFGAKRSTRLVRRR
jgi:hypothetical protein